eukprot:TRINITY_DN8902_c0_g1_i1.p2 TRINITY_DN8902_c0_g1~~TRINITY_DN8902_c0_g1_i1.p2  ORF type:complete len:135 (-),score=31.83 TRINITY_DN8902_c0_g1_i1:194-598(-)
MTRVYYQAAVGALVVYDVTRGDTFEAVSRWKKDIDNKVFLPDSSKIPCLLLANKCDLPQVPTRTKEEMDRFCEENGFVGWFETSSKESINIEPAFKALVERILDNDKRLEHGDDGNSQAVRLDEQGGSGPRKCC